MIQFNIKMNQKSHPLFRILITRLVFSLLYCMTQALSTNLPFLGKLFKSSVQPHFYRWMIQFYYMFSLSLLNEWLVSNICCLVSRSYWNTAIPNWKLVPLKSNSSSRLQYSRIDCIKRSILIIIFLIKRGEGSRRKTRSFVSTHLSIPLTRSKPSD